MEWDALLNDLEGQLAGAEERAWRADVAERTRGERAEVTLASRLAAARGRPVVVTLAGSERMSGEVVRSGSDWLLLEAPAHTVVVAATAIAGIEGLPRHGLELSSVEARLSLRTVLRGLARDRALVRIDAGAVISGVISAVGADHLDVLDADRGRSTTVPVTSVRTVTGS